MSSPSPTALHHKSPPPSSHSPHSSTDSSISSSSSLSISEDGRDQTTSRMRKRTSSTPIPMLVSEVSTNNIYEKVENKTVNLPTSTSSSPNSPSNNNNNSNRPRKRGSSSGSSTHQNRGRPSNSSKNTFLFLFLFLSLSFVVFSDLFHQKNNPQNSYSQPLSFEEEKAKRSTQKIVKDMLNIASMCRKMKEGVEVRDRWWNLFKYKLLMILYYFLSILIWLIGW